MKIVIDFDGTCVKNEFPNIGESIGAEKILLKWVEQGHHLILSTMRSGIFLSKAIKWFEENGILLYGIQKDPHQKAWTTSPKAFGHVYIDDCALGCPLIHPEKGLPYADWSKIEEFMEKKFKQPEAVKSMQESLDEIM